MITRIAPLLLTLALLLVIDEKKYSEALDLLFQILNEDDKDYEIWTELGTVYLMQKDFGKAEGAYQRAGEVNPSFFPSFFNLGRLRMAQKRFEAAIEPLNQSTKIKTRLCAGKLSFGRSLSAD